MHLYVPVYLKEKLVTAQPQPDTATPKVVVTPIPPAQSRTLRLTRRLTWLAPIIGFLPDVVGFLVNLWATDPTFAAAITNAVPVQYRALLVAVVVGLSRKYGQLRRDTSAPIEGTPAAKEATRMLVVALACLLAMGCVTTSHPVAPTLAAAAKHDVPWWEHPVWDALDRAFQAYADFLDRIFPSRAQPEHGGVCLGIVWTGTGYRCSESSIQDAGSVARDVALERAHQAIRAANAQPPKEN